MEFRALEQRFEVKTQEKNEYRFQVGSLKNFLKALKKA